MPSAVKKRVPCTEEEIQALFQSPAGFLGPLGIDWAKAINDGDKPILFVDEALEGRAQPDLRRQQRGLPRQEHHARRNTSSQPRYADLRSVTAGEGLPELRRAAAHRQGRRDRTHLQAGLQVFRVDGRARARPQRQGSHAHHGQLRHRDRAHSDRRHRAEQRRKRLLARRRKIAPFEIVVTATNVKDERSCARPPKTSPSALKPPGFDVLLDDRDERPGVKFKDADLVGIPFRVNVGKKVTEGTVEVVHRSTREIHDASIPAIADYFEPLLRPAR